MMSWRRKSIVELSAVFEDGDWIESKDQSIDGVRLIQTGNVGNGYFKDRGEKARYISEDTFKRLRCTQIFEGDCLISRLPDPVGRACILPDTGEKMITAVDCTIIRFDNKQLIPDWFLYYSLSNEYQNEIQKQVSGATRQRISRKNLGLVSIPLPPLPEQQRIVSILDEAFAAIAQAKANAEQNLRNAKELFESYLHGVFEKKGDGWEEKSLGEVYSFKNGINFDKTQKNGNGILTLDVLNMYCDGLKVDVSKLYRIDKNVSEDYKLKNEDILIVRSSVKEEGVAWATYFEEGDEPITYCGFIIRGRPIEKLNAKYVVYFLRTGGVRTELIKKATKSTITNINQANLSEIIIPIPPLNTQQTIVQKLDALSAETKKLEAIYQQKINDLEELKKSILQKAFSGELKTEKTILI